MSRDVYPHLKHEITRPSKEIKEVQTWPNSLFRFECIFSDSNDFLWHESYDINKNKNKNKKKAYFQNFSWYQFFIYELMHDYVHWHCSIDYCVKVSRVWQKMALIS